MISFKNHKSIKIYDQFCILRFEIFLSHKTFDLVKTKNLTSNIIKRY